MQRLITAHYVAMLLRVVALLLVALFTAAALHELFYALLGHEHEHDHSSCPFCILVKIPFLLGLGVCALVGLCLSQPAFVPPQEPLRIRRFILQPDPRAPPHA